LASVAHDGCEFGVVLDGTLEVMVGGRTHKLQKCDLISYPSTEPHRFTNTGSPPARTIRLNLKRDPMQ
jgi:quercetin dioxygenase-like cupin family protein